MANQASGRRRRGMAVKLTANFERNLADIERFLGEVEAPPEAFDAMLQELLETVIPNLEQFPGLGRPVLTRVPQSLQSQQAAESLMRRLDAWAPGAVLRELVLADHVVLYLEQAKGPVLLLAICHHRQLSFDFSGFWL